MSYRIRYQKTGEDNKLVSTRTYSSNGTDYLVELDKGNNTYKVISSVSRFLASTGTATSFLSAKHKAKKALEELGVTFATEQRKKKI